MALFVFNLLDPILFSIWELRTAGFEIIGHALRVFADGAHISPGVLFQPDFIAEFGARKTGQKEFYRLQGMYKWRTIVRNGNT